MTSEWYLLLEVDSKAHILCVSSRELMNPGQMVVILKPNQHWCSLLAQTTMSDRGFENGLLTSNMTLKLIFLLIMFFLADRYESLLPRKINYPGFTKESNNTLLIVQGNVAGLSGFRCRY